MSKRLPYYQSEPAEYLAGDIMFCTFEAQGVFSIIRALYWQKECNLTLLQAKRRLKDADKFIDELIEEGIIKVIDGEIYINFLDEQFEKASGKSKTNSENGKKGAAKRWAKKGVDSESIAPLLNIDSESIALREDKIRREEKREDKKTKEAYFISFWNTYPNKVSKKKAEEKFLKLSIKEIELIMSTINNFVKYKPFKDYTHPNPMTYLNQERWNDEIKVNGKVVKSEEEKKELVTFYWEHEGRSNKRTYPKDKAEAYFKNQAVGGYIAVVL